MHTVTCLACGWVSVAYSRAQAEKEVAEFNDYFDALTEKQRMDYYRDRKADIKTYEQCFCNGQVKQDTFLGSLS